MHCGSNAALWVWIRFTVAYHIQVGLASFKKVPPTARSKSLGFAIAHPSLNSKSPIEHVAKSTCERNRVEVYITGLRVWILKRSTLCFKILHFLY